MKQCIWLLTSNLFCVADHKSLTTFPLLNLRHCWQIYTIVPWTVWTDNFSPTRKCCHTALPLIPSVQPTCSEYPQWLVQIPPPRISIGCMLDFVTLPLASCVWEPSPCFVLLSGQQQGSARVGGGSKPKKGQNETGGADGGKGPI